MQISNFDIDFAPRISRTAWEENFVVDSFQQAWRFGHVEWQMACFVRARGTREHIQALALHLCLLVCSGKLHMQHKTGKTSPRKQARAISSVSPFGNHSTRSVVSKGVLLPSEREYRIHNTLLLPALKVTTPLEELAGSSA
jgi:hypothetical protein